MPWLDHPSAAARTLAGVAARQDLCNESEHSDNAVDDCSEDCDDASNERFELCQQHQ